MKLSLLFPRTKKILLSLLAFVVFISACSVNTDYLKAKSMPPIKAEDDADKERLGELYPVPKVAATITPKSFSVPLPPTVSVSDNKSIATADSMDDQYWVTYSKAPSEAWLQVTNFWQIRNIGLADSNPAIATMVTNWTTKAVQPGFKIRYVVKFDQGLQPDTTDIFLFNQKARIDENTLSNQIPLTVADRGHVGLLSDELVKGLEQNKEGIAGSFLATSILLPKKNRLSAVNEEPVILSLASEDRLNKALTQSLSENQFILYDHSIDQKTYYFNINKEAQKEKSKWKSLFTWGASKTLEKEDAKSLSELLARLPNEPEVNAVFPDLAERDNGRGLNTPGYLLILRPQDQQVILYLRDTSGRVLASEQAQSILDDVRLSLR